MNFIKEKVGYLKLRPIGSSIEVLLVIIGVDTLSINGIVAVGVRFVQWSIVTRSLSCILPGYSSDYFQDFI